MKKFFALVAVLALMGMGQSAFAKDEWVLSLRGLYVEPAVEAIIPFDGDLETSFYVGGKVGYQLNEYFSIEAEPGWAEIDVTDEGGTITTIPLLFNLRYNILPGVYMVDPYVFGGIGVSFNDFSNELVSIKNSFVGQVGGGAEYHFNEWLSAYMEIRCMFSDPGVEIPGLGSGNKDLNSILIGGGLVWRF